MTDEMYKNVNAYNALTPAKPSPSQQVAQWGSLLGAVIGQVMPQTNTPKTGWGSRAQAGNIEVWGRPGIGFTLAQPSPGIYLIVEYPLAPPPTVSGDPSLWAGLGTALGSAAGGIADGVTALTGGLVNTIASWIPGARRHQREQALLDHQAQLDAAEAAEVAKARAALRIQKMLDRYTDKRAQMAADAAPPPDISGACCASCARGHVCEDGCHV